MTWVKVFGERNTGTRYLENLLQSNLCGGRLLRGVAPRWVSWLSIDSEAARDAYFRATVHNNLGWKHRLAPTALELESGNALWRQCKIACLVKNPYSWVLSMRRRPYHSSLAQLTLQQLLGSPWRTVGRECAPREYPNIVELWNAKTRAYLQLPAARTVILTYEELILDPRRALKKCQEVLGLTPGGSAFKNIEKSTKGTGDSFADYRDYYLSERWRAELSPSDIQEISRSLDGEVMTQFGYKLIGDEP